jgi:GrpB-like predicted nucleotidyltransferase (UPF0157 family)
VTAPEEAIEVVPYDPAWPAQFQRERQRIAAALGDAAVAIEHIGSTAVPGLASRPIVDVMVGVEDVERSGQAVAGLIDLGFDYLPELEAQLPKQRYFRKPAPTAVHVHMVERGSAAFERHLLLRDYLRTHPEAVQEYSRLKRGLVLRFHHDRKAYVEGKAGFVEAVAAAASREAGRKPPDQRLD